MEFFSTFPILLIIITPDSKKKSELCPLLIPNEPKIPLLLSIDLLLLHTHSTLPKHTLPLHTTSARFVTVKSALAYYYPIISTCSQGLNFYLLDSFVLSLFLQVSNPWILEKKRNYLPSPPG
ncbi:hypothetical protein ABZX51_009245 [Aspergillus tubingensis]